jgi:hypothetical protein
MGMPNGVLLPDGRSSSTRLRARTLGATAAVLATSIALGMWAGAAGSRAAIPPTCTPAPEPLAVPEVAVDSQDRATLVWREISSGGERIRAVRRGADGTAEGVQTLSTGVASDPEVAVDSQDRATVVWASSEERSIEAIGRIEAARLGADGTLGAVQTLSEQEAFYQRPRLAIDSQDRATVVWQGAHPDGTRTTHALRLGADGTPGPVHTFSAGDAQGARVAVDSQGRATLVWTGIGEGVRSVRIGADGTPGSEQTLAAEPVLPPPALAVDSQDRATVVWEGSDIKGSGTEFEVEHLIRAVRVGADGIPGPVRTLSPPGGSSPQVAVDSQGRATVAWLSLDGVHSVRLDADGTPEEAQILAPFRNENGVRVVADSQDRATVVWGASDEGSGLRITKAVRLGADGTPGAVQTVSAPAQMVSPPGLAVDSRNRATVAWGLRAAVQAARLSADAVPGPVQTLAEWETPEFRLALEGRTAQRLRRTVKVKLRCGAACHAVATGRLTVKRAGRSARTAARSRALKLMTDQALLTVAETGTLKLKARRAGRRRTAMALRRGKKVVAKLIVSATSNCVSRAARRTVRLKR